MSLCVVDTKWERRGLMVGCIQGGFVCVGQRRRAFGLCSEGRLTEQDSVLDS